MAVANADLATTRLVGTVVGTGGAGVPLAVIRLRGSPESALTDVQGNFVLDAVETGAGRTLQSYQHLGAAAVAK